MTTWTLAQLAILVASVLGAGGLGFGLGRLTAGKAPAPVVVAPPAEHPTPAETADRAKRDAAIAAGELDPEQVAGNTKSG